MSLPNKYTVLCLEVAQMGGIYLRHAELLFMTAYAQVDAGTMMVLRRVLFENFQRRRQV